MLLFRSEEHIERWCAAHRLSRGAVIAPEVAWRLASAWYADRLNADYQRKTVEEAERLFAELGLVGPFWQLR
jgi:hypothetical protein